jgi:hypothetical protein
MCRHSPVNLLVEGGDTLAQMLIMSTKIFVVVTED